MTYDGGKMRLSWTDPIELSGEMYVRGPGKDVHLLEVRARVSVRFIGRHALIVGDDCPGRQWWRVHRPFWRVLELFWTRLDLVPVDDDGWSIAWKTKIDTAVECLAHELREHSEDGRS